MAAEQMSPEPAPILVLGVGNRLLRDDGVGLELLWRVEAESKGRRGPRIDFVDGGTQGLALLGLLDGRRAVLVLDAVARGGPAGAIHMIDDTSVDRAPKATTAHESSVSELLGVARLMGRAPAVVVVVGVEPGLVRTGIGLSDEVARAVPLATLVACERLEALCAPVSEVANA